MSIPLTRAAFERFWFRYCEVDLALFEMHASTNKDAAMQLVTLRAEVAEWWPILVEECEREAVTVPGVR